MLDTAATRKPMKSHPGIIKLYAYRHQPSSSVHIAKEDYERIVKVLGNKAIRLLVGYYNEQYKLNIKNRANYPTASKYIRAKLEESVEETLKLRNSNPEAALPLVVALVAKAEELDGRRKR